MARKTTTLSFRFYDDDIAVLMAGCEKYECTQIDFIRSAMREKLGEMEPKSPVEEEVSRTEQAWWLPASGTE